MKADPRIFLTGTGGQGTLTSTRLLAQAALDAHVEVVAGEVHGMAQRGGVVESAVLLGGWRALRIDLGEADILIGFEALETLRALPYLKHGGVVFSSDTQLLPLGVAQGKDKYPELESIRSLVGQHASASYFIPCHAIGQQAGDVRSGATALLGAVCASGFLPFGIEALEKAAKQSLPIKVLASNLAAIELGAQYLTKQIV